LLFALYHKSGDWTAGVYVSYYSDIRANETAISTLSSASIYKNGSPEKSIYLTEPSPYVTILFSILVNEYLNVVSWFSYFT